METITKIVLILNIFTFLIILRQLYRGSYDKKIIIKTNKKNRFSTIFFSGVSIILGCILEYLHYTQSGYIFYILLTIFWIESVISSLIRDLRSEIRENGIYCSGKFYEWSKVQSYSWILPTTIQFKVNTFFTANYNFEFTIKEELKLKVNETVQKYVL
jgi:uncharacterized membrane protein YobD (UPF0266 family)